MISPESRNREQSPADSLREVIALCVEHGFTEPMVGDNGEAMFSGELLLKAARNAQALLAATEKAIPNSVRDTILEETALALEDADQALVDEIGAYHFVRSLKRGADVVQIHAERPEIKSTERK
jgi:hypothetical protein